MKLRLEDIRFAYENYTESSRNMLLFDSVSLLAEENENILITGDCGSGKTTLCLIASLLCPRYYSGSLEGRILFDGRQYDASHEILDFFSLVPQNPGDYFLSSSVEDELAYPLESLGVERSRISQAVSTALENWGLTSYRKSPQSRLSGGEKKRLALAAAEVTEPQIVVYDESFDDLDAGWRSCLAGRIRERKHTSIVTSSRFLDEFSGLFDSIYRLECGRLVKIDEKEASARPEVNITGKKKADEDSCLSVSNLSFSRGGFSLSVPSFRLKRGEVVSLGGVNGSGKTTFARLLCSLERPDHGEILLDGIPVSEKTLKRTAGYVFQNPDSQLFLPSVRSELSYSIDMMRLSRQEKEEKLESIARVFSLDLEANPLLMSFGLRKKVQCAIYYSLRRKFYILDEIEASLPYEESAAMIERLLETGAGIMLISHDSSFASQVSDRHYLIEGGVMHEVE